MTFPHWKPTDFHDRLGRRNHEKSWKIKLIQIKFDENYLNETYVAGEKYGFRGQECNTHKNL